MIICSHELSRSSESREAKADVAVLHYRCRCLKVQVCLYLWILNFLHLVAKADSSAFCWRTEFTFVEEAVRVDWDKKPGREEDTGQEQAQKSPTAEDAHG